jgi:hypothetical protein
VRLPRLTPVGISLSAPDLQAATSGTHRFTRMGMRENLTRTRAGVTRVTFSRNTRDCFPLQCAAFRDSLAELRPRLLHFLWAAIGG